MTQQMYSIREAAQALGLETHVLRYWEEELEITIGRNPQGRRIYTEENLEIFKRIISCKEQGLQLKAIKELMDKEKAAAERERSTPRIILYRPKEEGDAGDLPKQQEIHGGRSLQTGSDGDGRNSKELRAGGGSADILAVSVEAERQEKARRLQELLKQFVKESVRESNAELLESVKEGLLKELDYQFRLQEEREEERERVRSEKEDAHFRELDENLRGIMGRRGRRKKKSMFGR